MSSTKPKLNVRLLRRIQKHILEEPRRFVMEDVRVKGNPGEEFPSDNMTTQTFAECGTAACIAGWSLILAGKRVPRRGSLYKAGRLLNLQVTGLLDSQLFIADYWPAPFRNRYQRAQTASTRAKIAAARIEHLITTGE